MSTEQIAEEFKRELRVRQVVLLNSNIPFATAIMSINSLACGALLAPGSSLVPLAIWVGLWPVLACSNRR